MAEELVKALRCCHTDYCDEECPRLYSNTFPFKSCHDDLLRAAADVLETLPSWIDAREKLPEENDGDWVIGVVNAAFETIEYIDAVELVSWDPDSKVWFLHEDPCKPVAVSWWMPLPEPPGVMEDET